MIVLDCSIDLDYSCRSTGKDHSHRRKNRLLFHKMCHTIITMLECGHREVGPVFRCDAAVDSTPRGPPHDDGRLVLCSASRVAHIESKSYCGYCVGELVRRLLGMMCSPCREDLLRQLAETVLRSLPTPTTSQRADEESLDHWT